jgi:hypothetical protein
MKNREHSVIPSLITMLVGTGCLSSKTNSAADRTLQQAGTATDRFHPKVPDTLKNWIQSIYIIVQCMK